MTTTLTIPHNAQYRLYVGYTLSSNDVVKIELRMIYQGTSNIMFEPNFPAADLFFCDEECREGLQSANGNKNYMLMAGTYQVQVTAMGTVTGLKLASFF